MQQHCWADRRHFLDKPDEEIVSYFREWLDSPTCPWYVVEDYLKANGMRARLGAGPFKPSKQQPEADPEDADVDKEAEEDGIAEDEHVEEQEEDEQPTGEDDLTVLRAMRDSYLQEISRNAEVERRCAAANIKHDYYRKTRCTSIAQEEQSATACGVVNVYNDSDDDDDYCGEQKEVKAEAQELRAAAQWINPPHWDAGLEAWGVDSHGHLIDLRVPRDANGQKMSWTAVKKALAEDQDPESSCQDFFLDDLDPTQRVFADRSLKLGKDLCDCYKQVENDGKPRNLPRLRSFFCGSAGSGKSTTLKTIVYHLRELFKARQVPAKIQLTAYTGVAAFNIGFGARTTCSGFQIFPNAQWSCELKGKKAQQLEAQWGDVELLIVDEISFIGRVLLTRMHYRLQQGRRAHFAETAKLPEEFQFGDVSVILVGDFGQLEPIDDFSICELRPEYNKCPARLKHLWKHATEGVTLTSLFKEAVVLKRVHRSKEDMWWTESCLRLRNLADDVVEQFKEDYTYWRDHDLDRGHFSEEQKRYFETEAVRLCARCEDVGMRNGRKLAHQAQDLAQPIHRIAALHASKASKVKSADAFGGLRSVVNLSRGCKVMITRNVAYLMGLANGTRGKLVGVVYPAGASLGSFPEAVIVAVSGYCGPAFYPDEPTWVPILPMSDFQGNQSRTQFPIVAGFAMTINKSQGLTIEEGVVVNLQGSSRFRPASQHGLPFVALTRSESFAMTAFKNIPPLDDFLKGLQSGMLKSRKQFDARLEDMHRATLKAHSHMQTAADEKRAHDDWKPRTRSNAQCVHAALEVRPLVCPACARR